MAGNETNIMKGKKMERENVSDENHPQDQIPTIKIKDPFVYLTKSKTIAFLTIVREGNLPPVRRELVSTPSGGVMLN